MRRFHWVLALVALGVAIAAPPGSASPTADLAVAVRIPDSSITRCALLYPPYDPAVNYCGPEWLQEAGFGFLVPRDPISGFDFSPACYVHDACYSECCANGMSQADCDTQFLQNLTGICIDTAPLLASECGWNGWCIAQLARDYVSCVNTAVIYTAAVSMLGDGVIELSLLAPFLGPSVLLLAQVVPGIQIEAAYPCPCACITCPADVPLGTPNCQYSPGVGAVVSQPVTRHVKEGTNVSGVGPVCECVARQDVATRACPAGVGCAYPPVACADEVCLPQNCNREQNLHVSRCEQRPDAGGRWAMVTEWEVFSCRPTDAYGSVCASSIEVRETANCPWGCAPDGLSCATDPGSSLTVRVMEPRTRYSATYVYCPECAVRLEGVGGTFEGTTTAEATLTFGGVPAGSFVAWYGCGPSSLGAHLPSDLARHPSVEISWMLARGPHMDLDVVLPTVVTPIAGVIEVLAGRCGPSPTCSAHMRSRTPTPQDIPDEVAATRLQIVEAASACDYDTLGSLASWPYFIYSRDESGSPGQYWQSLEQSGSGEPLRWMIETLNLPAARVEVEGDVNYIWPAAWAASSWDDVPPAEQSALMLLYGPEVQDDWDLPGGYARYRLSIGADGLWGIFMTDDR